MANFLLTSGEFTAQTLADTDSGFVGQNAIVSETTTTAITGGGPGANIVSLTVQGQVAAISHDAVQLQADAIYVTVGATGVLSSQSPGAGQSALNLNTTAFASLYNDGTISGGGSGVFVTLDGASAAGALFNAGTIRGGDFGLNISGATAGARLEVQNSGSILGMSAGIVTDNVNNAAVTLVNSGVIWGRGTAIAIGGGDTVIRNSGQILGDTFLGGGRDTIVNSGVIDGDIDLGSGNDRIDTRSGEVLEGMNGQGGNDTFLVNAGAAETITGGGGVDMVVYSGPVGAVFALDGSFEAEGAAQGDSLLQVEQLTGTVAGADVLRGNGGSNLLSGRGGADQLDGAGGVDSLVGGQGADTLTGGLGNDLFIFNTLAELGDVITDFTNRAGNNDRMQFAAAAFGLGAYVGLAPAALLPIFQSRADNLAVDADDRFIFRTTDRSLWFDADGNGAGAAVMVADLQAGATFSVSDLLIQ